MSLLSVSRSLSEQQPHLSHAPRQSQHSTVAKSAIMSGATFANGDTCQPTKVQIGPKDLLQPPPKSIAGRLLEADGRKSADRGGVTASQRGGVGSALTDTPLSTAPSSPRIQPQRRDSASSTPRIRPTTLDIPGLTRSKVSPDGRISSRDIGSKLIIVMVGLPARGKSYITKKMARYLNWLQHDTKIFNVGERRRVAASTPGLTPGFERLPPPTKGIPGHTPVPNIPPIVTEDRSETTSDATTTRPADPSEPDVLVNAQPMDQSAEFFDPKNTKAAQIREQLAMSTLDELLDYILLQGGSVGILDATNSNLARRKAIIQRVRERAGPHLGVLFLESLCYDQNLLESNMRLKLSGPDYKDQDPITALADFKKRVAIYERNYIPLGEFEEKNNMQYVQMIDVGRKIVSHQIRGFLAALTVSYLVNFNLSPRQIWITRHGESMDNVRGKIGGDSELSENGQRYARALTQFITHKRKEWTIQQQDRAAAAHFPPHPGDKTPPYATSADGEVADKNFCVWTSMLKRSMQTAEHFDEEEFDVKQMKMLDELNAGEMEGMTYEQIRADHAEEYDRRRADKLHYRYPRGESYLDVINRLRAVIVEVERMTDHVLLVCHRSVARVLLAYFLGLNREAVSDVDVPLGVLYMLEPKPYGVDFKVFRYDPSDDWFHLVPNYELRRASSHAES